MLPGGGARIRVTFHLASRTVIDVSRSTIVRTMGPGPEDIRFSMTRSIVPGRPPSPKWVKAAPNGARRNFLNFVGLPL